MGGATAAGASRQSRSRSPPVSGECCCSGARAWGPPRPNLLALTLLVVATGWGPSVRLAAGSSGDGGSSSSGGKDSLIASHCARYFAFEAGIAEDLLPWYDQGISEALADRLLQERTMGGRHRAPGLPLAVVGGRLYVVGLAAAGPGAAEQQRVANCWPWQAENLIIYAHAMRRLVARWGGALPDLEFTIETQDVPAQDLAVGGQAQPGAQPDPAGEWGVWPEPASGGPQHGRLPSMRHCKAATSTDIAVPIFHFYTLHLDEGLLTAGAQERLAREHPWEARLASAFAAGTNYHRHQAVASTLRQWDGKNRGKTVEMVREALADYLAQELRHPNITYSKGSTPMADWARHRMVMHVDGISCSSRIVQLLALGSVVLREQSGYTAFYDRLLAKFVHYVPFWSQRPREVLWAYNWVLANDEAARAIAGRGQAFARHFLSREAVECFWLLLLRQYARLQRFRPGARGPEAAAAAAGAGAAAPTGTAGGAGGQRLVLTPIDDWLAKQEGTVTGWAPTHVADRGRELDLLPAVDMTAGAGQRGTASAAAAAAATEAPGLAPGG
ncbi:hypothetical protein HXX76_008042 [Chlamydomonas incerta]|uniref:Glycosyl transferase CAP10 domain-containing protein n=1 Tax=Chlamydomonas incerta TaxID=51695 RepID=A0A835T8T1_CHLIN|nr:hypothetical protein HXX76_008042 [Chlamydomonas incerta]|eukprot:KAG2433671.1 hypothetical protein HXX76_008042 [Chlamydomonas incerta]